jgi:hypothetical protein
MSDYFSTVKQGLGDAVERRAHLRWYSRLLRASYARPLAVVLATLVVATPAVGAVAGWFSFGKPNVGPPAHAGIMWGLEKPGSSRLLPMRTPDPLGGPAWGLRMVKTSRGDTCVQLGRVEKGQIGSLGIDDAWNNDGKFHAISASDTADDQCGSTDAAGYGYLSGDILGEQASANVYHQGQGSGHAVQGCRLPQYMFLMDRGHHGPPAPNPVSTIHGCPAGAGRVVFYGLLGPDATSITYRKPGGGLATKRTSGGVGAYLLVFPYDEATCKEYSQSATRSVSCDSFSQGGVSPGQPGAVTKITYQDGHSCTVLPSASLRAAYKAFNQRLLKQLGRPKVHRVGGRAQLPAAWIARYRRLLAAFLAREHLTQAEFRTELGAIPSCPAVGWVASRGPKITRPEVRTPIVIRELPAARYPCPTPAKLHLPEGCNGYTPSFKKEVPVEWSFEAREPVTDSRRWYEWSVSPVSSQTGTNCGGSSFATYANIGKGQMLRYSQLFPASCKGKYTITVGYMAAAPPGESDNGGGGGAGRDGSLLVGRTSFTIR